MKRIIAVATLGLVAAAVAQQPYTSSGSGAAAYGTDSRYGTAPPATQPAAPPVFGPGSSSDVDGNPMRLSTLTIIREQSVPAEEAGVLESLNYKEGDLVEQGAILGLIDKTDAQLAVEVAKREYNAAYKTAKNELRVDAGIMAYKVAKAEYDASIEANQRTPNVIPKTDVRRQRMEAERAKMQSRLAVEELKIAEQDAWAKHSNFKRAEAAMGRRTITSGLNGVVVKRNKFEGEWVQPGETVMRIVQMDQLYVEGSIDGKEHARHTMKGRPVTITVYLTGGGEEVLRGKIEYVSSLVRMNTFVVRVLVDNRKMTTPDGSETWLLSPGLKAEIELD